jgi:hypothetical protein
LTFSWHIFGLSGNDHATPFARFAFDSKPAPVQFNQFFPLIFYKYMHYLANWGNLQAIDIMCLMAA